MSGSKLHFTIAVILLFLTTSILGQTTITSKSTGGAWFEKETWVGNAIPTNGQNIVINGTVYMNGSATCNTITINSSGTLYNDTYWNSSLTATSKIINYGTIRCHPTSGYQFYIYAAGDIENYGTWTPNTTTFQGGKTHSIKQSSTTHFQGKFVCESDAESIAISSNVSFIDNSFYFNDAPVSIGNHTFSTNNYTLERAKISSTGILNLNSTSISTIHFMGNYTISGSVYIRNNNYFDGNLTLKGTIHNDTYYNATLYVPGNLVNEASLTNHPTSGYSLYVDVKSNLENRAIWSPRKTFFTSDKDQEIKQTTGKYYEGEFETTDSIGDIILASDVTFINSTWYFKNSLLQTNGFKLTTTNYTLVNGKILSDDTMLLDKSRISGMTFNGDYQLDGNIYVQFNNVFNNTATILDSLYNDTYYNSTLITTGEFINNGTIINHPTSGYSFYLDVRGNIENNGIWNLRTTTFNSDNDQYISQSKNTFFQSTFSTPDSIGDIILKSNVNLRNSTWEMNKSQLLSNGNTFSTNACRLTQGKIISNDTLRLHQTNLSGMYMDGNYFLDGRIQIQFDNVFDGTATILDTIHNDSYYNSTLKFNGDVINKGTVMNHPSTGYKLYIELLKNIKNENVWQPNKTTFINTTEQLISQNKNVYYNGYFTKTDSLGAIILDSDVTFSDNTFNFNNSILKTEGYRITTNNHMLQNGKIATNDTLTLNNTLISNLCIEGEPKLKGKIWTQHGNEFIGNITNLDTIYNDSYYNTTLLIDGDLTNNGVISNHPTTGYRLNLKLTGNLLNTKSIAVRDVYLSGSGKRTIGGNGAITGSFVIEDPITLTGTNSISTIKFTDDGHLTVDEDAIINLYEAPDFTKVTNNNRISVTRDIDNTTYQTNHFYAASAYTIPGTELSGLTIDNYGNQQHPNATGAVNSWWRLRNTPQTFGDSLHWLKLIYRDEDLNGSLEDSLKVFHSPNAGLSWKRIKEGYEVNTSTNTMYIENAPSYGHYLLSSTGIGVINFQPYLETAEPKWGGNSGYLTMYLFGAGFKENSNVILRAEGYPDIIAEKTWLTDAFGESMNARFDLQNKQLGTYDVIVETPGSESQTLEKQFIITTGQRSEPWSSLTGRDRFLIKRWQTFRINYGNTANTDAMGTVLVFVIKHYENLEVKFPDFEVVLPQPIVDMGDDFTRFAELDYYYLTDSLSGYEGDQMRVYPFLIPYIPAGASETVRVRVKLDGDGTLNMDSWLLDPLFEDIEYDLKSSQIPAEVRACLAAAGMKAFAGNMIGLAASAVPGAACWGVIDKTVDPIGYITPESVKPDPGQKTWGSWLWNAVSIAGSVVQCGASFVPGVGTAVSMGIDIVNMTIDIKDGYDTKEACWRKFRKKSKNKFDSRGVTSFDPNEIVGPKGYTDENYISKESSFDYTIFFENKKTAGASALEVFVYDTLDTKKYDLNTFSFNSIAFADTSVAIQSNAHEFQIMVDMYPQRPIIVQVHGKLDTVTGVASWDFHSLDRITMELTEDPDMGFLLPNVTSPEGEGHVTFSCKLKETVTHNDTIANYATIIFDFNKPIVTNIHTNLIDEMIPVSAVDQLNAIQTDSVFTVSWSGEDMGSEILNYSIFVSENDSAYTLWKVANLPGEAEFIGKNKTQYSFFSVATDSVGFVEPLKTKEDASTYIDMDTYSDENQSSSTISVFPNPAKESCTISLGKEFSNVKSIALEDISGRHLKMVEIQSNQKDYTFSLDDIPDGIYFIRINYPTKSIYRKISVKK